MNPDTFSSARRRPAAPSRLAVRPGHLPRAPYVFAIVIVGITALAPGGQFPALQTMTVISTVAYCVVSLAIPAHRIRVDHLLSPSNWMTMGWALQLVLIPELVATLGPTSLGLAILPEDKWMAYALGLQVVAFLAYALGRGKAIHGVVEQSSAAPRGLWVPALAAIGLPMLIAWFGGVAPLFSYLSGGVTAAQGNMLLSFGAPLLGTAGVLWAAWSIPKGRNTPVAIVGATVLLLLGFGTSGYSRGMFLAAGAALAGVLSVRWRRIPVAVLSLLIVIALIGAIALGGYRSSYLSSEAGWETSQVDRGLAEEVRTQTEVYMRAPQYLSVVPKAVHSDRSLGPAVLMNSMLAPIPVLGSSFREDTTRTYYSPLVRGTADYSDISPPVVGELYWTLGPLGLLGFVVVGRAVRSLDRRFYSARTFGRAYVWMFMGVWMGYTLVGSVQVMLQTAVLTLVPLCVLYWVDGRRGEY